MMKLWSDLHSRTTPHTSPLRASFGVSFASYTKKNDRDISGVLCEHISYFNNANFTWFALVCSGRERLGELGCYDVIVQPGGVTWYEASKHCADSGRTLLAIESTEENDAIENHLIQSEGQLFLFVHMKHDFSFVIHKAETETEFI